MHRVQEPESIKFQARRIGNYCVPLNLGFAGKVSRGRCTLDSCQSSRPTLSRNPFPFNLRFLFSDSMGPENSHKSGTTVSRTRTESLTAASHQSTSSILCVNHSAPIFAPVMLDIHFPSPIAILPFFLFHHI